MVGSLLASVISRTSTQLAVYAEIDLSLPIWRVIIALICMIAIIVVGLVVLNIVGHIIRRYSDAPNEPARFQGPPSDDWAQKRLIPKEGDMEDEQNPSDENRDS